MERKKQHFRHILLFYEKVKNNITCEIAGRLNLSNSTVHDHLKRLGRKIISHFHKKKTKLLSEQPNTYAFLCGCNTLAQSRN
ncbi:hypothetical protein ALC56_10857 [Trachymyrmex septentrionalis]|uniref:Uncharacterized protein n=1 Tax=Trachymyrmex septentrionalis TaxID=34720 RepID=A0A195F477_9HYME|nr:hypothetical protein ALC56_10857 [Trachymyrmex septentrionalis]